MHNEDQTVTTPEEITDLHALSASVTNDGPNLVDEMTSNGPLPELSRLTGISSADGFVEGVGEMWGERQATEIGDAEFGNYENGNGAEKSKVVGVEMGYEATSCGASMKHGGRDGQTGASSAIDTTLPQTGLAEPLPANPALAIPQGQHPGFQTAQAEFSVEFLTHGLLYEQALLDQKDTHVSPSKDSNLSTPNLNTQPNKAGLEPKHKQVLNSLNSPPDPGNSPSSSLAGVKVSLSPRILMTTSRKLSSSSQRFQECSQQARTSHQHIANQYSKKTKPPQICASALFSKSDIATLKNTLNFTRMRRCFPRSPKRLRRTRWGSIKLPSPLVISPELITNIDSVLERLRASSTTFTMTNSELDNSPAAPAPTFEMATSHTGLCKESHMLHSRTNSDASTFNPPDNSVQATAQDSPAASVVGKTNAPVATDEDATKPNTAAPSKDNCISTNPKHNALEQAKASTADLPVVASDPTLPATTISSYLAETASANGPSPSRPARTAWEEEWNSHESEAKHPESYAGLLEGGISPIPGPGLDAGGNSVQSTDVSKATLPPRPVSTLGAAAAESSVPQIHPQPPQPLQQTPQQLVLPHPQKQPFLGFPPPPQQVFQNLAHPQMQEPPVLGYPFPPPPFPPPQQILHPQHGFQNPEPAILAPHLQADAARAHIQRFPPFPPFPLQPPPGLEFAPRYPPQLPQFMPPPFQTPPPTHIPPQQTRFGGPPPQTFQVQQPQLRATPGRSRGFRPPPQRPQFRPPPHHQTVPQFQPPHPPFQPAPPPYAPLEAPTIPHSQRSDFAHPPPPTPAYIPPHVFHHYRAAFEQAASSQARRKGIPDYMREAHLPSALMAEHREKYQAYLKEKSEESAREASLKRALTLEKPQEGEVCIVSTPDYQRIAAEEDLKGMKIFVPITEQEERQQWLEEYKNATPSEKVEKAAKAKASSEPEPNPLTKVPAMSVSPAIIRRAHEMSKSHLVKEAVLFGFRPRHKQEGTSTDAPLVKEPEPEPETDLHALPEKPARGRRNRKGGRRRRRRGGRRGKNSQENSDSGTTTESSAADENQDSGMEYTAFMMQIQRTIITTETVSHFEYSVRRRSSSTVSHSRTPLWDEEDASVGDVEDFREAKGMRHHRRVYTTRL